MYRPQHDIPCEKHTKAGYKKGCPDCFDLNRTRSPRDIHDDWDRELGDQIDSARD